MANQKLSEEMIKHVWHTYLTTGDIPESLNAPLVGRKFLRPLIKRLPQNPRCNICYVPFEGIGGNLSRIVFHTGRSKLNPHLCNNCDQFATYFQGGVELEISMLFVDVRGSTTMAENMSPEAFGKLITKFYGVVTEVFYRNYGFVEKLLGDEVAGFFVPGFAGQDHAKVAIETGRQVMKALGYGGSSKPWIPAGVGINTGRAYVGSMHTEGGVSNISMLGDAVNITARLTSQAGIGEILISEATRQAAGLDQTSLISKALKLKGKSEEVKAWGLIMNE
jgi:adenylate cyclase